MKNLFAALVAIMLLLPVGALPAGAQTRQNTTLTRFAGEKITGVAVSAGFDVVLVKSASAKAVVEIDREMEQYLDISLSDDGIVSVGIKNDRGNLNIFSGDRTLELTLYLPELRTVMLSGGADLTSADTFVSVGARSLDIMVSGGAEIERLTYSGPLLKVQASGGADVEVTHDATDLYRGESAPSPVPETTTTVLASGGADVELTVRGVSYTKLASSGGAEIDIKGNCGRGVWTASGGADITGDDDFTVRELNAIASGAGRIRANVTESLTASASGRGNVFYRGNPGSVNVDKSSSGSVKKM